MGQMGTVISKVVMLVVLGSGSAVVLCDGQFSRRPIAEMKAWDLSLIHISEPTRRKETSRMPSSG